MVQTTVEAMLFLTRIDGKTRERVVWFQIDSGKQVKL